jgi:hypothetical protein
MEQEKLNLAVKIATSLEKVRLERMGRDIRTATRALSKAHSDRDNLADTILARIPDPS